MSQVFAMAVNVLFADPALGEAGTFTAPPAAPVPVRVILSRHDTAIDFGALDTQVRAPGWEARVRQYELPTRPALGSYFTINSVQMTVKDTFEDLERLEWICDVSG